VGAYGDPPSYTREAINLWELTVILPLTQERLGFVELTAVPLSYTREVCIDLPPFDGGG